MDWCPLRYSLARTTAATTLWALLVHGKAHDRLVFLRPDVAEALRGYVAARDRIQPDTDGEPLLAAVGNFAAAIG